MLRDLLQQIIDGTIKIEDLSQDMHAHIENFTEQQLFTSNTLQQAFGIHANEIEFLYTKAYSLYQADHLAAAAVAFRLLVLLDPYIKKYWMGLAACQQLQQEFSKALKALAVASALDIQDPYPHFYAYQCYKQLQELQEAQKALELAKSLCQAQTTYANLRQALRAL